MTGKRERGVTCIIGPLLESNQGHCYYVAHAATTCLPRQRIFFLSKYFGGVAPLRLKEETFEQKVQKMFLYNTTAVLHVMKT